MIPTLEEKIRSAPFQGDIDARLATRQQYAHDASLFEIMPSIVVAPKSSADIQSLVKFVTRERLRNRGDEPLLSLTARSAGTDMSGGPLTNSIVVDVTKYLNRIGSVDTQKVILQPGVFYRDLEKETVKRGVLMPAYTASKDLCTVGGMVANNSGGEKSIKYGKTDRYVKRLKVIFSDSNEYEVRPLSKEELDAKIAQDDFEGRLYRDLFTLIQYDYTQLQLAKPRVSKNSSGYALWNVWNPETGVFDLTQLITGSQGTLGIITEIEFALVPIPKYSRMAVVYMHDIARLGEIVDAIMQHAPESFESYDDYSMKLAMTFAGDFFKELGFWKALRLGLSFIPDGLRVLTGGVPKLLLMAEVTGDDPRELERRIKNIKKEVKHFGYQTHLAKSAAEVEKYWKIRRESFNLLRKHSKGKRTAPFIDDIIVDPHYLPAFLPRIQKILADYKLIYTIAGHAGNGNFHIIPLMKLDDPFSTELILEVSKKVYALVAEYKGSLSAEHNDGIIRTPFLSYIFPMPIIELFEKTKAIFDPLGIFNPGKKVHGTLEAITSSLIKTHQDSHGS